DDERRKSAPTAQVRGSSYDGNMRRTAGEEQPASGMAASNLATQSRPRRGVGRPRLRLRPPPSDQGFIFSSACCIGTEETLMNPANGRSMSKIRFTATDTENAPANIVATTVAFNGA